MDCDPGAAGKVRKQPFEFPAALEGNDTSGTQEVEHLELELDTHPAGDESGGVDDDDAGRELVGLLDEAFCSGDGLDEVTARGRRTDEPEIGFRRAGIDSHPLGRRRADPGLPRCPLPR